MLQYKKTKIKQAIIKNPEIKLKHKKFIKGKIFHKTMRGQAHPT